MRLCRSSSISRALRAPTRPSPDSTNSSQAPASARLRNTKKFAPRARTRPARSGSMATYYVSFSGRTIARAAVSVRGTSDSRLGKPLQRRLHVGHEAVGVGAVDHPMVECEREQSARAYREAVRAVHRDDRRLLLDGADAENRDLRLVDDRRADHRSENAGVRDRERALLHFVRVELLGSRALAEVVDRAGDAQQRELVGATDHGNDEPPVERHRDAEIDVAPEDGAL